MSQAIGTKPAKVAVIYKLRPDTVRMLKELAGGQHRTYSAQLEHLIESEYERVYPNGFSDAGSRTQLQQYNH